MVAKKGVKAMADEMVTEEILACVELYSLQFVKKVNEVVERSSTKRIGCKSLRGKGNGRLSELKKRKANVSVPDGYVPPLIPPVRGLFGLIKDCTFPFVKQLTATDLKADQSRLSFSRHDAENLLLPMVKGMNLKLGVATDVYDMDGNLYGMTFKTWCDKYYVLTSGWNEFWNDHKLRKLEDFVTVWMFRHGVTKKLCFALSSRRCNVHHLIKKVGRS